MHIHEWVDHNEPCSAIRETKETLQSWQTTQHLSTGYDTTHKATHKGIAANSPIDSANILNVPGELKCYLCSSLPIEFTTCQKYACAECCCQSLRKAEAISCPCCGTDHVADFDTVRQPPEAVLAFIRSLT